MKHFYAFALLLMFNINFAQDARLFGNTWHLTRLTRNSVDYVPLNNAEVQNVTLGFDEEFPTVLSTVLNYCAGTPVYTENTSFACNDFIFSLMLPNLPGTWDFENVYFDFFNANFPNNTFAYTIADSDGVLTLTLTSSSNDVAVYSNQLLAGKQFEKSNFTISPNPAKAFISLDLEGINLENATVEIYNTLGKLCQQQNLSTSLQPINVEALGSGLYILKIKTTEGVFSHKFIKE